MNKKDAIEKALAGFINRKDWDTKVGLFNWSMAAELYNEIKYIVETTPNSNNSDEITTLSVSGKSYIKGPAEKIK